VIRRGTEDIPLPSPQIVDGGQGGYLSPVHLVALSIPVQGVALVNNNVHRVFVLYTDELDESVQVARAVNLAAPIRVVVKCE